MKGCWLRETGEPELGCCLGGRKRGVFEWVDSRREREREREGGGQSARLHGGWTRTERGCLQFPSNFVGNIVTPRSYHLVYGLIPRCRCFHPSARSVSSLNPLFTILLSFPWSDCNSWPAAVQNELPLHQPTRPIPWRRLSVALRSCKRTLTMSTGRFADKVRKISVDILTSL